MSRVLVTGAGGYIGTTVVPALLQAGHSVRAVDRFFFGQFLPVDNPKLQIVQDDCRKLEIGHFNDIDYVIDLVAISNDPSGELFQRPLGDQLRFPCSHRRPRKETWLPALYPPIVLQHLRLPAARRDRQREEPDESAHYLCQRKRSGGERRAAASRRPILRDRAATIDGLWLLAAHAFRSGNQRMTYGAWKTGKLPLMRDGSQWRPMVHVKDVAAAMNFMLEAPSESINGQIFNIGSSKNNYQIGELGRIVARTVPRDVEIEWYGRPRPPLLSRCL